MSNKKFNRLIVFGDSNTFGQGLSDVVDLYTPSQQGWPSSVAAHYGWELCNKAIPGSGNDSIIRNLRDYILGTPGIDADIRYSSGRFATTYRAGDLVMIALTSAYRLEFHSANTNTYTRYYPKIKPVINTSEDTALHETYKNWIVYNSELYFAQKILHELHTIITMCRTHNIPFLVFHAVLPLGPGHTTVITENYFPEELRTLALALECPEWIKSVMHGHVRTTLGNHVVMSCGHLDINGNNFWARYLTDTIDDFFKRFSAA